MQSLRAPKFSAGLQICLDAVPAGGHCSFSGRNDISTRLGALEDELPPAPGRVIVQCVDDIDEMQRWLEGRE